MTNSIELTKEEKESLEYYTSRKCNDILDSKGYANVNGFLRTIISNKKPAVQVGFMYDEQSFKDFLKHIENIFSVACKYGTNHELPPRIFRGYDGANKVITQSKQDKYGTNHWMSDQFLSCSRSEGETRAFSKLEVMYLDINDYFISQHQIPFIDVNDILGSDQGFGDEKEILIPPFFDLVVKGKEVTPDKVYYDLEIEPFISKQTVEEEMYELSDADIKKYFELTQEYYKNNNKSVEQELLKYQSKIKTHLHNRMSDLQFQIMMNNSNELDSMFVEEQQEEKSQNRYY